MKKIELTQGKYALVDDEDFHYLSRFEWCLMKDRRSENETAATSIYGKSIYMHELILPVKKQFYLKHKNNDNLDNRKENLEMISSNHRRHLGLKKQLGASQYRGVQISGKRWRAMIAKDKKDYFLGSFDDERAAALAYNAKARELYGDYAFQNKIDEPPPCSNPDLDSDCSGCTDLKDDPMGGTHQGCTRQHGHVGCVLDTKHDYSFKR